MRQELYFTKTYTIYYVMKSKEFELDKAINISYRSLFSHNILIL